MPRHDKRGRLVCECTGYWFPHRRGSGACEHSETRFVCLAHRYGDDEALAEALIDLPARPVGLNEPCPF